MILDQILQEIWQILKKTWKDHFRTALEIHLILALIVLTRWINKNLKTLLNQMQKRKEVSKLKENFPQRVSQTLKLQVTASLIRIYAQLRSV